MPHSIGGGSHSGGLHSGSHSSSRSGGAGITRSHSTTYFPGARHYVYYKNSKPVHYYSDKKITPETIKKRKRTWNLVRILLIAFYALIYCSIFFTTIYINPHKLDEASVDDNQIWDYYEYISDSEEQEIMEQLEIFKEKTGIAVTIMTLEDANWYKYFATLETYAYDVYVTEMNDEKSFLLAYSEPFGDSQFVSWQWIGIQGDDTDSVLNSTSIKKFKKEMQKNITKDGFAKAVIETFKYYNDIVMDTSFDMVLFFAITLGLGLHFGIFFLVAYMMLGSYIKIDSQSIELADPKFSYVEDVCKYCNGVYIHGIHTSCPHCGGNVEPLDRPIIIEKG